MKYILNEIPIKTTNNFNINNLKIELNLPNNLEFKEFKTKNIELKYNIINSFNSKVGLNFNKALDITIDIKDKIDENIELLYEFSNNDTLIDNININFHENSKANIIMIFKSIDNGNHFHHLKENLNVSNNSNGTITIVNLLNQNSTSILAIENNIKNNSKITHNLIDIGGNIKINNIYSVTNKYSENYLNNIYVGINDIIDMNYNYINNDINSTNIIESQGVLDNKSTKKFRGTIDFIKDSKKSIGKENENCILLSDNAISSSVPILLCGEEDVIGNHSISSGKIDDDKLFYLMSRGLNINEAKKLIIFSNFNKIISNIPDDNLKNEIIEKINSLIK